MRKRPCAEPLLPSHDMGGALQIGDAIVVGVSNLMATRCNMPWFGWSKLNGPHERESLEVWYEVGTEDWDERRSLHQGSWRGLMAIMWGRQTKCACYFPPGDPADGSPERGDMIASPPGGMIETLQENSETLLLCEHSFLPSRPSSRLVCF